MHLASYFWVSGISVAAFAAIFLLVKKRRQRGDLSAVAVLVLLSLPALLTTILPELISLPGKYLFLRGVVPLAFSPALYLYVCRLSSLRPPSQTRMVLAHFAPLVIALAVLASPLVQHGSVQAPQPRPVVHAQGASRIASDNPMPSTRAEATPALLPERSMARPPFLSFVQLMTTVSFGLYALLILRRLREHRARSREYFSFASSAINLDWLGILIVSFALIHAILLAALLVAIAGIRIQFFHPALLMDAGYAVFSVLFAFFALNQERIFLHYRYLEAARDSVGKPNRENKTKYGKSALDEATMERLFSKIEAMMEENLLFRNNDLTLEDLAARTGISRHYISQTINEKTGRNFFGYINKYRIDAVIRSFHDQGSRERSLLELALAAGFNSKSSFINYFKEATGKTPQQYRLDWASQAAETKPDSR